MVNGESDDGGLEEFCEFCPSWRFNSATSACNAAISVAWLATRAVSSSYDGRSPPTDTSRSSHRSIKSRE